MVMSSCRYPLQVLFAEGPCVLLTSPIVSELDKALATSIGNAAAQTLENITHRQQYAKPQIWCVNACLVLQCWSSQCYFALTAA